jgi:LacI family transcriptional regulator
MRVRRQRRRVALLIEASRAYGRGLLLGISLWMREHQTWLVLTEEWKWTDGLPAWLTQWTWDGVIARIETRAVARAIERFHIPAVDLRGSVPGVGFPLIDTDDEEVARIAAEHLLERGFRDCAFCGFAGANYSEIRGAAFESWVRRAGTTCHRYAGAPAKHAAGTIAMEHRGLLSEADLTAWLASLPKPVGVMACNDIRGQQVVTACKSLGLLVPDDVAVVGVDNDEVLCELSDPPLSSVAPNTVRIGYEAAALLEEMMEGRRAPAKPQLIPPLGLVTRRSTDVLAISDRSIAAALRCVREHACEGLRVPDLLRVAALSRSVFERRFTKLVGRSPKAEILRVQLARAKQLLAETDLPLATVADHCGFRHAEYFSALFRVKVGMTPGEYRKGDRGRTVARFRGRLSLVGCC